MPRRRRGKSRKRISFRLTKGSRTADFDWLHKLDEDQAFELFKRMRWRETGGNPVCPHCQSKEFYIYQNERRWKCAQFGCRKKFSVTSGTIFHSRKLPFVKLVRLIFNFVNSVKGLSAVQASHLIDCCYDIAYVNLMKVREAMSSERNELVLSGELEIDGAYIGGHVKQTNLKKNRVNRKTAMAEKGQQRAVLSVVEKRGGRAIMFAADGEDQQVAVAAVRLLTVDGGPEIIDSDGHVSYSHIGAFGTHRVIDHEVGFSIDGVSTNAAESTFSRMRRAEFGSYHHVGATYLDWYAGEMSWRENWRRVGNREAFLEAFRRCLGRPQSRVLKGYKQRWMLPDDLLPRNELRWTRIFGPLYSAAIPTGKELMA